MLFPDFLLSLTNWCGIQLAHLNLGVAGEGSLLLALHEEKRPILGEIQGPALNSEIWPRAPITRFPILVVKKEQGKKKNKLGEPWCCSEGQVSSWKVERILKYLGTV